MINEAIGLSGIYAELGIPMIIVLQLDSTAAIGMIQRRGTGRARHMDLRHLFLQERLRDGTIGAIEKIEHVCQLGRRWDQALYGLPA